MTETSLTAADARFEASAPEIRSGVLFRAFGTEAVAWSPLSDQPIHLDPVGAIVYELLDGTATIAELVSDVHDVLGVPRSVARNQIRQLVGRFDDAGLLTTSEMSVDLVADNRIFLGPENP